MTERLGEQLPQCCPECGSEDTEWGHDATAAGQYCNECEAYVQFVDTEDHASGVHYDIE